MSDERGNTYWASFIERIFGLVLIVLGAVLLYLTVTTASLGTFIGFFSFLSIVMVVIGIFLLIIKPSE